MSGTGSTIVKAGHNHVIHLKSVGTPQLAQQISDIFAVVVHDTTPWCTVDCYD